MIDFRYHLVSIVSIFMALAVGIVLGAGPLKGTIGESLTQEVTQLREDRTELRAELDTLRRATTARDEFTADARARLVGNTLTGTTVALVILPGADGDDVSAVTDTLTASGAVVVSRTTVDDSWVPKGDEAAAEIARLATEQRGAVGLPPADEADPAPLDDVLANTLVSGAAAAGPVTDAQKSALDAIVGAGYVDVETADFQRATNAVLVSGLIQGEAAERDRTASRLAGLAAAIDRAGKGAVVTSDVGVTGFQGATSVVRAVRGEAGIARNVSTVDDVSIPLGQVSVVYALVQQNEGGVGQYGFSDGVSAAYPPIPVP